MTGATSPYILLGLKPDADRAAIDEAYRRLIKLHHPDRSGGDATRAAEINFAYARLKRAGEFNPDRASAAVDADIARRAANAQPPLQPSSRRSLLWPVLIMVVGVLAITNRERIVDWSANSSARSGVSAAPQPGPVIDPVRTRLSGRSDPALVAHGVAVATTLLARSNLGVAGSRSEACFDQLDAAPDPDLFDRCVAFDDAVVALTGSAMLEQQSPFSLAAMARRHMRAARLLSTDDKASRARLARIRSGVAALIGRRA